jgi:hypothetical protein
MKLLNASLRRTLQIGSIAILTSGLVACGGSDSSGGPPSGTISGTAAVGTALANATVQLSCKNGSGSTTTNSNGAYTVTFGFDGPCAITASGGGVTLYSFAAGTGTFNVTPLTELLLDYLAAEQGTTLAALVAGVSSNASFQAALTNSSLIANGENTIVQLLSQQYGISLATTSFLSTSFTPGQPGLDANLDALQAAGAINSNGTPSSTLQSAVVAAGTAAGKGASSGATPPATGGTGGSGTGT